MKIFTFFSLFFAACAATDLSYNGRTVALVTGINPTELNSFQEIGPVSCYVGKDVLSMGTDEDCKNQLRNRAADMGADLVVIEGYDRKNDSSPKTAGETSIYARAYRKKKSKPSASSTSQPTPTATLVDFPAPTGQ
jgi:hypothetical protein